MVEGAGVWLATDYEWSKNTFDPDTLVYDPRYGWYGTLDIDDKLILQKAGGNDERYYNLPLTPPDPWTNYGVWFDRDGVDPWQATYWGCINGKTYNTGGMYGVVITLHATSATSGTAYMTVNGVNQGFWVGGWKNAQPTIYPAGMTFTGNMEYMQVFYGLYGYGVTHSVVFEDITVTGCLYNEPPVADAGPDQIVEQTSYAGAEVTLDGSKSTDDGQLQPLTYTWTWDGGSAAGVNPTVTMPLGKTTVTLTVYDGQYSDTDTVDITVQDTTPPKTTVLASPDTLWPPNHKYVDITATVTVSDICDPSPTVTLVSVTSNEPDDAKGMGDGNTVNDIVIVDNYHFKLRAERDGAGTGRIYTITYKATDASGNTVTATATVIIPHDES